MIDIDQAIDKGKNTKRDSARKQDIRKNLEQLMMINGREKKIQKRYRQENHQNRARHVETENVI